MKNIRLFTEIAWIMILCYSKKGKGNQLFYNRIRAIL